MRTDIGKRSKKAGMPPGTLLHVGTRRQKDSSVTVIDYDKAWAETTRVPSGVPREGKRAPSVRWVDMEGLHRVDLIAKLGKQYHLHPLVQEDILQTGQRPKMEDYEDHVFIVVKMLRSQGIDKPIESEQVSIILKKNLVLTFQEGIEGDVFDQIRARIRNGGQIRSLGADYLVYSLMDAIVDQYFVILERLGERIEQAEKQILENPTTAGLKEIQALKHELMVMRKSTWSLREVVAQLERGDSPLVKRPTIAFFRDLHDHVVTTIETIESYREMISGLVELAMSSMSNRMNEVMKTLTVIATIFIPLTFIVGVYGMNFDPSVSPWNMPELKWAFGYPASLIVMGLVAFAMVMYFRRKRWF